MASRDKVWIDELGVYVTIPTAELGVPTIDSTTGALVNPLTGAPVPNNMQATEPKTVTPSGPYSAAATGSQTAPGTIGTLTASPTLAEVLARQMRVDFAAGTRAFRVDTNNVYSAKACGPLYVSVHAADDVAAAGDFQVYDPTAVTRIQPGQEAWFAVGPDDPDIAYAHFVHELAGGAGYTDVKTTVQGYDQAISNALVLDSQSDLLSQLTQKYIYVPMHETAGSTQASVQSNISAAPALVTINGTTTNIFATRGQITPSGDNYATLPGTSNGLGPYTALGPLIGVGVLLVMFQLYITTAQSTGLQYAMSRDIGASTGGWGLAFGADRKLYFRYRGNGEASQEIVSTALSTGTWHSIVAYYDCVNGVLVPYIDGSPMTTLTFTNLNNAPTPPNGNALNLMRLSGTATSYMGLNSGVSAAAEFCTVQAQFDLSPYIADIAFEFVPGSRKLPLRAMLRAGL